VGGQVAGGICFIAIQELDTSLEDAHTADDTVLGLYHFLLALMVLGLRVGAFLDGCMLEFVARV
jgi:hypothetical protein